MTDTPETNFVKSYEPGRKTKVELKNAKIVNVENGDYFDPAISIVLENGKIAMMPGLHGEIVESKPDYSIDLGGKAVIPSLFNTHCHIVMATPTMLSDFKDLRLARKHFDRQIAKNMAECLSHGITNIRDCYTEDQRILDGIINRIASGEIPGPRILKAIVVGPPGSYMAEKYGFGMKIMRSSIGIPTLDHAHPASGILEFSINANEQQVRDAVNRAIDERGAEVIKIGEQLENMTNFRPDSVIMKIEQMEDLADQARKRGVQSTIHHVSVATFRRAVQAGVSSLAHFAFDDKLTQADIDAFIKADCIVDPTLTVVYDTCFRIEGTPFFDAKGLKLLTHFRDNICTFEDLGADFYIEEFRESLRKTIKKLAVGKFKMLGLINLKPFFLYYLPVVTNGFENLCNLYKAGGTVALSNDGGVPPGTPAMMGLELRLFDLLLDKFGDLGKLKGIDAIRIATINSARSMGLDKNFGTIEPGKVGDLVVVDGDPLADASLVGARVAALFKDGELFINNCNLEVKKGSE